MAEKLTIVEQKEVVLYDDELIAVRAEDGQIYVSVRHMCLSLELDNRSQRKRIQRQKVLEKGYASGVIMTPGGVRRTAGLLRADLVPLWLTGIDTSRVKDAIKQKLERFQEEAAKVLWEAFQEGRLTADQSFEELLETDSPAVQAYKTFQALTRLARGQVLLEAKVDEHEKRLENIEARLSDPDRFISREQASRISQAVRAIGLILTKSSGSSEYGRVYGELYRRYEISAYRELSASKYEDAMKWLNDWRQSLVDDVEF